MQKYVNRINDSTLNIKLVDMLRWLNLRHNSSGLTRAWALQSHTGLGRCSSCYKSIGGRGSDKMSAAMTMKRDEVMSTSDEVLEADASPPGCLAAEHFDASASWQLPAPVVKKWSNNQHACKSTGSTLVNILSDEVLEAAASPQGCLEAEHFDVSASFACLCLRKTASASPRSRPHCLGLALVDRVNG